MSTKFNKSFLKRILAIPSYSYREERMRDYILAFAKRRGITATTDSIGNVYLTKGEIGRGEYVPCFVNHMDTVQEPQCAYVFRNECLPVRERKNEEGKTEQSLLLRHHERRIQAALSRRIRVRGGLCRRLQAHPRSLSVVGRPPCLPNGID